MEGPAGRLQVDQVEGLIEHQEAEAATCVQSWKRK
jgi:hypothetical protein